MRLLDWFRGHQRVEADGDEGDRKRRAVAAAELWLAETQDALESARLTTRVHSLPAVIDLKSDEEAYLTFSGAHFIEPVQEPSRWIVPSQGISLWLAKASSYRGDDDHDNEQPGHQQLSVTDRGTFVVTSQRCVFIGVRMTMDWAYAHLVGFSLEGHGSVLFRVSNRQKPAGVLYGPAHESRIDAVIVAAIAKFQGGDAHDELIAELEAEVAHATASLRALQAEGWF
jgi:hypothetical protein